MLESFKFDPLHYIVKAIDIEIKVAIDRAYNRLNNNTKKENYIIITVGHSNYTKINYDDILFIELTMIMLSCMPWKV